MSSSNSPWKELTKFEYNPNYKYGDPWANRGRYVPTGEKQCVECFYVTDVNDLIGMHVCPVITDCEGNEFTIGDKVVCYAKNKIRTGIVTKYNAKTGMISVQEETADYVNNLVINSRSKILRVENDN